VPQRARRAQSAARGAGRVGCAGGGRFAAGAQGTPAMTRLWLVRHGPTHARGMCGWSDLPANLSDHEAINRLSLYLPDAPIVASDLVRAIATASAIGGDRPRLPHDPDLREMHFGDWELR